VLLDQIYEITPQSWDQAVEEEMLEVPLQVSLAFAAMAAMLILREQVKERLANAEEDRV
jgi:hypothetical protein